MFLKDVGLFSFPIHTFLSSMNDDKVIVRISQFSSMYDCWGVVILFSHYKEYELIY